MLSMRNKERFIFENLFVLVFLCFVQLSCANNRTEKYVGIDEGRGNELSLKLAPDNTFIMTTWRTDSNGNREKCDTIKGRWLKEDKILILTSTNNKICYKLIPDKVTIGGREFNMEQYTFFSNGKDFFGTNFDLTQDPNDK